MLVSLIYCLFLHWTDAGIGNKLKIIGRELPEKVKVALQLCGLGLVMLLMIFVTYQDILRIFQ